MKFRIIIFSLLQCILFGTSLVSAEKIKMQPIKITWSVKDMETVLEKKGVKNLEYTYYWNGTILDKNEKGITMLFDRLRVSKLKRIVISMNNNNSDVNLPPSRMPGLFTRHLNALIKICRFKGVSIELKCNEVTQPDDILPHIK